MATSVKNAIARALVEGVITDLMLKTNTDNVVLDDNGTEVTLSAKLAEYIAALNGKATPEDITNALNSYVKKDGRKVLSTNDFTTDLLNKLNGIAAGAQVNKIETIKVNGTAQNDCLRQECEHYRAHQGEPADQRQLLPDQEPGGHGGGSRRGEQQARQLPESQQCAGRGGCQGEHPVSGVEQHDQPL